MRAHKQYGAERNKSRKILCSCWPQCWCSSFIIVSLCTAGTLSYKKKCIPGRNGACVKRMHDWDFASSRQQNELICGGHPLKFQRGRFQQVAQLASYLKRHLGRMHWLLCINVEVAAANKTSSLVHLVNIVKMNWHCVQTFAKYWQVKACSQTTVKCWQVKGPEQQIGGWSNYHTHWQLSPHHNSHARIARAQGTCRNSLF